MSHWEHKSNLKTFKLKLTRNQPYFPNRRQQQSGFGLVVLRPWLSFTWLVIDFIYERNKFAKWNILQHSRAFWVCVFFPWLFSLTLIHGGIVEGKNLYVSHLFSSFTSNLRNEKEQVCLWLRLADGRVIFFLIKLIRNTAGHLLSATTLGPVGSDIRKHK